MSTPALERALGTSTPRERRIAEPLEAPTANVLRELAHNSGVAGDAALVGLVLLMRWHVGRGPKPHQRAGLTVAEAYAADITRRRAWELVDANRHRLPPVNEETAPHA